MEMGQMLPVEDVFKHACEVRVDAPAVTTNSESFMVWHRSSLSEQKHSACVATSRKARLGLG